MPKPLQKNRRLEAVRRKLPKRTAKRKNVLHPNAGIVPEGERPCPICGQFMQTEVKRKVAVDVCSEHGVWLDTDELERIIKRVGNRVGGIYKTSLRRVEKQRDAATLMNGFLGWI